jgi:hypothetical protein
LSITPNAPESPVRSSHAGRPIRPLRLALPLLLVVAAAPIAVVASTRDTPRVVQSALPARLSAAEFWKLVTDVSEPDGYFRIVDNFTSNEREIGQLFTMLRERGTSGGVYLGVGPEQNFTYIAAIRPVMAFIIDIRRQAVMQHLMYKALFEMAHDRAEFLSLLFAKARPSAVDSTTPIQQLWDAYWNVPSDSAMWAATYERVVDRLTRTHGFTFTDDEAEKLRAVSWAFYWHGPVISTRGRPGGFRGGNGTTFADLTGYSYDASGQPRSFLSSEENYRYVKSLHEKNLIVPVSGDFGGTKALRAIGDWLRERGGVVSAFYVSNVEQYLFQDRKDRAFYENVATLPVNDSSVFIRPYSLRRGADVEPLCPMAAFLVPARVGQVYNHNDALACVR